MADAIAGGELTFSQIETLREQARNAATQAYAPYSKFRVGAAVLLESGETFTGCNVENCSFGLTNCAERSAIFTAVSKLGGGIKIRAIAVANLNDAASAPCGACRQVIGEFATAKMQVFFPGDDGDAEIAFADLLPLGFALKKD